MTVSSDGNWYNSNNGGTCYKQQLASSTSPVTNDFIKYDANGNTTPVTGISSPSNGVLTLTQVNFGVASSIGGVACFFGATGSGSTCLVSVGSPSANNQVNISNMPNGSTIYSIVGSLTPGDCIDVTGAGTGLQDAGAACGSGSGGANPPLDFCVTDQTGNSFPAAENLTNGFAAQWGFQFNTTTYIMCQVYIKTAQVGATIVLDIWANDATTGHTATFQTCDVTMGATLQFGSPSCASGQTFTTTSTAYAHSQLTFNVQSSLSNNSILVVKIATTPTGTAPTAPMLFYPHFIL